ncbi:MAG: hypothetical protein AAFW95_12665 [Cyanobacteria bacterium J06638_6]
MERSLLFFALGGELIMDNALISGLEVIAVVTVMTVVICPMLLWVLPDRSHSAS